MEGVVDPETLYTKQKCIGMGGQMTLLFARFHSFSLTVSQGVGALVRSTRGPLNCSLHTLIGNPV